VASLRVALEIHGFWWYLCCPEVHGILFKGQLIFELNTIWNSSVTPRLYKAFIESVAIDAGAVDLTSLDKYSGGERFMTAYVNGLESKKRATSTLSGFTRILVMKMRACK